MNTRISNGSFINNNLYKHCFSETIISQTFTATHKTDEFAASDNKGLSSRQKCAVGGGILGLGGLVAWGPRLLCKRAPKPQNIEKAVTQTVTQASNILDDLLKGVKPELKDLAREIYPVLLRTAKDLKLKTENFEKVLTGIPNHNKDFMVTEGFDIVAAKAKNLEDIIGNPTEAVVGLSKILNKENKSVFNAVADAPKQFFVADIDDIIHYLSVLKPENINYYTEKLIPKFTEFDSKLKIISAQRCSELLKKINPETEDMIAVVANTPIPDKVKLSKTNILITITPENKACVQPLIENSAKLGFSQTDIINSLNTLVNQNAISVAAVAKNIDNVKQAGLKPQDLFGYINSENDCKIFDTIITDPEKFLISEPFDIKILIDNLDAKNVDFIKNEVLPKILKYKDAFGIEYPDQLADTVKSITPKTVGCIDTVASFAKENGSNLYYPYLFAGITEDNVKNLPNFLKNVHKTELWQNDFVSPDEFKTILDKIV